MSVSGLRARAKHERSKGDRAGLVIVDPSELLAILDALEDASRLLDAARSRVPNAAEERSWAQKRRQLRDRLLKLGVS